MLIVCVVDALVLWFAALFVIAGCGLVTAIARWREGDEWLAVGL